MGLLDMGGAQPSQPQGGLLGSLQSSAPAKPQGAASGGLQMAMALAANPTPEMAQQVVQQMRQFGMPEAGQFAQIFQQIGGNSDGIRQVAEAAIKALSGQ